MAEKTPNHICRNPNCPNGINGLPKHYWACDDCDKYASWRAVACSPPCYIAYVEAATNSKPVVIKQQDTIVLEPPESCVEKKEKGNMN